MGLWHLGTLPTLCLDAGSKLGPDDVSWHTRTSRVSLLSFEPVVFGQNKLLGMTGANKFNKYFLAGLTVGQTEASGCFWEDGGGCWVEQAGEQTRRLTCAAGRLSDLYRISHFHSTPRESGVLFCFPYFVLF